jgi:hypothetical protein
MVALINKLLVLESKQSHISIIRMWTRYILPQGAFFGTTHPQIKQLGGKPEK